MNDLATASRREGAAATAANIAVYADPKRVGGYVTDPYHATRRRLARQLLEAELADCPGGPVLEVGSGGQSLVQNLPGDRPTIEADINEEVLPPGGVRLDVAEPLPFESETLSVVLMAELIEHLFTPSAVLAECHRVLKPGGVIILTTPNLATLQDRLRFLLGRSPRQVDCLHPYLQLHIRPFTASSLRRLLDSAGFTTTALKSNHVGWELPSGRWVQSRFLARVVPTLGGSLVIAARRRLKPEAA